MTVTFDNEPVPEKADVEAGTDGPVVEAEAEPEAPVSRDETHSSIDPQTGALTPEAVAARVDIRAQVLEAHPDHPDVWHEIIATWHKMCGDAPDEDDPGLLEPPPPPPPPSEPEPA